MKTTIKTAMAILMSIAATGKGLTQTINWQSLKNDEKHILNLHTGYEFGLIYSAGYGYHFGLQFPAVMGLEYSFPSGGNITDDFKSKVGANVRLYHISNFHLSVNIFGVYRRYETDMVRMKNFGSDLSGIVGYYRNRWFIAGEVGFDKAIVTNLKHSQNYRDIYPEVTDGWYSPPSGGNFYYGLQTGFSFRQSDIYVKAGKIITQDFKTEPTVPYFAQIGYNFKF